MVIKERRVKIKTHFFIIFINPALYLFSFWMQVYKVTVKDRNQRKIRLVRKLNRKIVDSGYDKVSVK